jgi:hypothetical protein
MTVAASAARREENRGCLSRERRKLPMVASLNTGYDTAYLTDAVGTGAAATDYYGFDRSMPETGNSRA